MPAGRRLFSNSTTALPPAQPTHRHWTARPIAIPVVSAAGHFQTLRLGRDYGDKLEVLSGLQAGRQAVVNPGDTVKEGSSVNPVVLREKKRTT